MRRLLLLLVVLAFAVAGCGGDSDDEGAATGGGATTEQTEGAAERIQLEADPTGALRFNAEKLEAKAGNVQLVMTNGASLPHNVAIKGNGVDEKGEVVGKGEESVVTATLEPGTYTFYCSVPGHEAAGMKGDLVVTG